MGIDGMDYSMKSQEENETDLSFLVEQLTAAEHKNENICNNQHFDVQYILRPVAETTLREFIDTCVRNVTNFPENWQLCTKDGSFNCDPVSGYVSACEVWRSRKCDPSNGYQEPGEGCTMGMMMSQSTGLLILFALVLIGVLIGISITVAACLICPKMHGWANKKIRGDNYSENGKPHPSSVFHLDAMDSQGSSGAQFETQLRNRYPIDRNFNTHSDDYTYIGLGGVRTSGNQSVTDYEGLRRNNSQQQSHKYAYLPQTVPDDRPPDIWEDNGHLHGNGTASGDNEHLHESDSAVSNANRNEEHQPDYVPNYFVLEKQSDQ